MRTSNPAFNERAFGATAVADRPPPSWDELQATPFTKRMTVEGVIYKTAALLALTIATAAFTWLSVDVGQLPVGALGLAFFFLLGTAVATAFRPRIAIVTGPIYAVASGAFIGVVTSYFEAQYPGIAMQAGVATMGTLVAMLIAYRTGLIKVTKTFMRVVVTATAGIMVLYIGTILLRFAGIQMPLVHDSGPLGILLSVGIVIVAALNLVLDFHIIERATAEGAEPRMEWYGAFALLVTLVWLYLEILRLLAKLRD